MGSSLQSDIFLINTLGGDQELRPSITDFYTIGNGSYSWTDIYAVSSTINTSDKNKKTDIQTSNLGLDFVKKLNPVSYRMKDNGKRRHYGLIAQDINDIVDDFAGYIETEKYKGLRYMEFISPILKSIKELHEILIDYKQQVKDIANNII